MIEVYKKENKNYDYNGDITLQPISCYFEMETNGICQIELNHYIDDLGRWNYLVADNVIACPTMYSKKQLFRIYEVNKSNKKVKVYARHIFFDSRHTVIFDKVANIKTCQETLNIYLTGTGFTGISNITSLRSSYANRVTIMEILGNTELENSIVNTWGGERLYNNFTVYVNERIGGDYGVKVNFAHNLDAIEAEESIDDVVTRIVPVSKDEIGINEKYIDSNFISNYSSPRAKVIQYNDCYINEQIVEAIAEIKNLQNQITIANNIILTNNVKIHSYNKTLAELHEEQQGLESQLKRGYITFTNAKSPDEKKVIKDKIDAVPIEKIRVQVRINELTSLKDTLLAENATAMENIVNYNKQIEDLGYDDLEGYGSEEEVKKVLKTKCYEEYANGIDQPYVNYKIDMVNIADSELYKEFEQLENISIGDTVYCRCKKIDIEVVARCNYIKWNCITRKTESLEIGNTTSDFVDNLTSVSNAISKITGDNGTVKADAIKGVINAVNTSFKAQRSISQKQQVRAMLFEDLDGSSVTYGAMSIGTMGFCIANKRTTDGKEWDWSTFGTGKGFFADYIVAGTMLADRIKGGILEIGGKGLAVDGSITVSNASGTVIGTINKNGITMNSGSININNKFIVDSEGKLKATSGEFTGEVNATGGTITGDMTVTGKLNGAQLSGGIITGAKIYAGSLKEGKYDFEATSSSIVVRDKFYLKDTSDNTYMSFTNSGKLTIRNVVMKMGNSIIIDPKTNAAVFENPQKIYIRNQGESTQGYTWDGALRNSIELSDGSTAKAWDIGDVIQFICRFELKAHGLID